VGGLAARPSCMADLHRGGTGRAGSACATARLTPTYAPVWRSGRLNSHRHTRQDKTVLSVSCLASRCELGISVSYRQSVHPSGVFSFSHEEAVDTALLGHIASASVVRCSLMQTADVSLYLQHQHRHRLCLCVGHIGEHCENG